MLKWRAIPEAFQRRNLVEARAPAGLKRQRRIRADRERQDVIFLQVFGGNVEAVHRSQFVVGVKRRRMANGAAFPLEDLLPAARERVELVRVGRGLQTIEVKRKRVELLVAIPAPS